jgi:hypothetical protein
MTTPDIAGLCERLRKRATASFEANKNFGRKGKEWAIDTEVEWQAADTIERQAAEIERLRGALKRQADNMAFALNRVDLRGWTEKFSRELAEDRAALTGEDA